MAQSSSKRNTTIDDLPPWIAEAMNVQSGAGPEVTKTPLVTKQGPPPAQLPAWLMPSQPEMEERSQIPAVREQDMSETFIKFREPETSVSYLTKNPTEKIKMEVSDLEDINPLGMGLTASPKTIYNRAVQGAEWINENLIGEWITDPVRTYKAFASGDPEKVSEATSGLLYDVGNMLLQVGTTGSALATKMAASGVPLITNVKAIQGTLQQVYQNLQTLNKGVNKVVPRQALQQVNQVLSSIAPRFGRLGDAAWEVVKYPFIQRFLPSYEGRKSIAEVFQPAVERLEKGGLDVPFRKAAAQKAITSETGKELGKLAAGRGVQGRYEVYKALRGIGTPGSPEVQMVKDWKRGVARSGVSAEYNQAFQKTLKTKMGDQFLLSEDSFFHLPAAENFINAVDGAVHGTMDAKVVQKALKGAIEDANVPKELQLLARDLYNLPYSTPAAVGEASKKASTTFLINNLKRMGVVQDTLPQGARLGDDWWLSKFHGLDGAFIPRDVEMELRAIQDIPKMLSGNGVLARMNKLFMSPWKVSKLILNPPAHFRNMMTNAILNDVGGLPFWRVDMYIKAAQELKSKGKFFRELQKETGMGGSFSLADIENVTGGMKYGSNVLDHAYSKFEQMTSVPSRLYNLEEQWFKLAKYMHNRGKGQTTYEAAMDAMKYTFNYGEITRSTAAIRGSIAPFFTWTSKVIPLMAEAAVKHPIRFAKWPLMFQGMQMAALDNLDVSDDEWKWVQSVLPEYIKQGAFYMVPWRDDKDRLQMLNMTYIMPGLGDMSDLMRDPAGQLLGSPFLTMSADILRNKTYSGTPIYYDWEEPSTKWAKVASHLWQSIIPGFAGVPGSVDWEKMYDTITDTPDSLTYGQIMASQMGLRVAPIDVEKLSRSREALDNIHMQEMGSRLNAELRKARSPEEAQRIGKRYEDLRARYQEGVKERQGR